MKYHVKYYDERRNLIGGDEWHTPPGTSYFTIGMEVLPDGLSPVAGYQLTGEELSEALDAAEQRTQVHTRPGYHSAEEIEPAPGQPIFGRDGREVGSTEEFPLTSFCRCGRQIIRERADVPWQHSD